MYRGNKFKNAVGAHLLKALFYEVSEDGTRVDCLYSLKQEDSPDIQDNSRIYPSIHRLYVEMGDATEYEFAKKYFDNWAHWKKLIECTWFKPYLAEMREELDVKLKAVALNSLRSIASDESNKNHYMANKFIIENGLGVKKDARGRPSKEKIKEEANKLFLDKNDVDEDFNRINKVN